MLETVHFGLIDLLHKMKTNAQLLERLVMCFVSFIGCSRSFPKLINEIFGWIRIMGCNVGADVLQTIDEAECESAGGVWGKYDTTNINTIFIKFKIA